MINVMQMIPTMMTNDNDSVVYAYGDDGNDAHHAAPLRARIALKSGEIAAPRPGGRGAAVESQKGLATSGSNVG